MSNSHLRNLLDRLISENMHGPLVQKGHTRNSSSTDQKNDQDWVLLGNESYGDLDAKDPR